MTEREIRCVSERVTEGGSESVCVCACPRAGVCERESEQCFAEHLKGCAL